MDTEVLALLKALPRIEAKLDMALARGEDHEKRVRLLETKAWLATGWAAGATGVLGWLGLPKIAALFRML